MSAHGFAALTRESGQIRCESCSVRKNARHASVPPYSLKARQMTLLCSLNMTDESPPRRAPGDGCLLGD